MPGIDHDRPVRGGAANQIAVLAERSTREPTDLERGLRGSPGAPGSGRFGTQTVKELPQPHPPLAAGLLKLNPEPIMLET